MSGTIKPSVISILLFIAVVSPLTSPPLLADSSEAIESITVTARRTEESLQSVPISVSALSRESLEHKNLKDISGLGDSLPNVELDFTAPISGSSNASAVYIRGVGQSDFLLVNDPGVGVYLDGIYISRAIGGVLGLLDTERVEVLRGPQGTLFGRNTIGGAINVVSRKPQNEDFGSIGLDVGNQGVRNTRFSLNMPLLKQRLFTSFAGSTERRDGYVDRLIAGDTLGALDRRAMRAAVLWLPNERLEANFRFDYSHADEEGAAVVARWIGDPQEFGRGTLTNLYNTFAAPGNLVPGFGSGQPYDQRFLTHDPYKTYGTGPSDSEYEIWGSFLILDYDADRYHLKSLTGYRTLESRFGRDPDASPISIVHTENVYEQYQFSQELQLSGNLGNRGNWLTGFYYFKEEGRDKIRAPLVQGVFEAIGLPVDIEGLADIRNQSTALFGHAVLPIGESIEVSGGVRYSYERKGIDVQYRYLDAGLDLLTDPSAFDDYENMSYRVALTCRPVLDQQLYFSYATGFKSGGFTGRYVAPADAPIPFNPERLKTWEIGFKADWLKHRLRTNAALFYSEYSDIQVLIFNGIAPETRNAAEGRISGFELELTAKPHPQLELTAGLGYLNAEYTEIGQSAGALVIPLAKGNAFVNTPEWSAQFAVNYSFALSDFGVVSLYGDYSYRSRIANDAINTPELVQSALGLFNGRAEFSTNDDQWSLVLYGKNLTDERYLVSGTADKPTFGVAVAIYAPPREVGAKIIYRF